MRRGKAARSKPGSLLVTSGPPFPPPGEEGGLGRSPSRVGGAGPERRRKRFRSDADGPAPYSDRSALLARAPHPARASRESAPPARGGELARGPSPKASPARLPDHP